MLIALSIHDAPVTGYHPAPIVSIAPEFPQDVFIGDVRRGDIIEAGHTTYLVNFIQSDTLRGGYDLTLTRCSDGFKARSHSLYVGKVVTLLNR